MHPVARARRWLCIATFAALCGEASAQAPVPAPGATPEGPARATPALEFLCSVPSDWCIALASTFSKETGIPVRTTQKAPADALALLTSQRSRPRYDIWYAGVGDLHIDAAQAGLTDEYRSPVLPELREWSTRFAEQSGRRSVALYQRAIGIVVNTRLLEAKQLAEPRCWSDLADARYDDQLQMANPSQGATTRATIVALAEVYGEVRAFDVLKRVHENVAKYARRGTNAARAVARGDVTLAIAYLYEGANEVAGGFPVKLVTPCEGLAFDVVAMSIVKGARSPENAQRFYDWALSPASLALQYQFETWQMPAHRQAPLHARVLNTDTAKTIPNDYEHFTPETRRRMYAVWERDVGVLPR